jgi:uncharacterized protein
VTAVRTCLAGPLAILHRHLWAAPRCIEINTVRAGFSGREIYKWSSAARHRGDSKAVVNLKKHGVGFDEACTVFDDPLAMIFRDEDHSIGEVREIIIGSSLLGRLVLVYFTERAEGVIRIFSARQAAKRERRDYEDFVGQQDRS